MYIKLFASLLLLALLTDCRQKKKKASGDKPIEVSDFIAFFKPLSLPYQLKDADLQKKEKDSSTIKPNVFRMFVSDSLLLSIFGKGITPRIHPLGRVDMEGGGNFLFTKLSSGDKKAVYILWFNKDKQYVAGIPVLRSNTRTSTTAQSVQMDRKYGITRTLVRTESDGSTSEGKDVYGLNPEQTAFMLIMTDALDDQLTELINPIDTLSRKHKFSADYLGVGKMNLVSIRDGRKTDRLSFFIHIDKDNGDCTGELKGEAFIRSATMAEYRLAGDPCVLRFNFSSSSVSLSEVEGCGSHRSMRCSFNGTFTKKKTPKPKTTTQKNRGTN